MRSDSVQLITIVHTETGMCLTTKRFDRWQDIQAMFDGYKTSLGPYEPDDLLDYLQAEYPNRPPFSRFDVLGLAHRTDAYSWAMRDLPKGDGLKLGSIDGESFRLAVDGLQFPDAAELEKRFSWYVVEGSASRSGEAWDFAWQALTCDAAHLICGWLFEVASWIELGPGADAPSPPWLIEPNLQFTSVSWENGRALLTIELDLEFRPPAVRQGRKGAGSPETLRVRATAEELRNAAIDLSATIARHPVPSGPSRPVEEESAAGSVD